ncbi:hypothetical protein ACIBI3_20900 [Actinomadura luteofluorescens]|uniref:hypothetical protein n=1 Tax=Actinomadura luteofluorescens TaxID=46163 RepID=UPI00346DC7C0
MNEPPTPPPVIASGVQRRRGVRNRYTASRVVMLLGTYWRINTDLASLNGCPPGDVKPVLQCLTAARESLERDRPDVLSADAYLALADRLLLRLLPDDALPVRCAATLAELETAADPELPAPITETLRGVCAQGTPPGERRAALEAALTARHRTEAKEAIEDSLQVRRLQHLITYCGLFAGSLLVSSPFLSAPHPVAAAIGWPGYAGMLAVSTGLMLVGAAGGLFSRLLQVRDGRTSLLTYRTDMLKLGLSPLIGAMVALIVQLLAGWNVVSVLESTGPGSLIILTFLSGFSEKFLLRLLQLSPQPSSSGPHSGAG